MRRFSLAAAMLLILMVAGAAHAQTVAINPTTVQFTPSADHDALEADGTTPVVTRYELRMYLESDPATAITTTDLGKPAPVAGTISVVNPVWFAGLTPRTRYVATVSAVGAGGTSASGVSNPFARVSLPAAIPAPPLIR